MELFYQQNAYPLHLPLSLKVIILALVQPLNAEVRSLSVVLCERLEMYNVEFGLLFVLGRFTLTGSRIHKPSNSQLTAVLL